MNRRKIAASREQVLLDKKQQKAMMGDFVTEDVHQYRVNRHSFTIFLSGDPNVEMQENDEASEPGVEYNLSDRFEMNLDILTSISHTRPILINMSSCGGHWEEGMKVFGAILACPNPVTVLATKWARSMTSMIPLAADRFVIRPPATYMFHYGTSAYHGLAGEQMSTTFEEEKISKDLMLRIYVARLREQGKFTSWPDRRVRSLLEERMRSKVDVWLSADEAKEWGFADDVYLGDRKTLRATKRNNERRQRMLEVLRKPVVRAE